MKRSWIVAWVAISFVTGLLSAAFGELPRQWNELQRAVGAMELYVFHGVAALFIGGVGGAETYVWRLRWIRNGRVPPVERPLDFGLSSRPLFYKAFALMQTFVSAGMLLSALIWAHSLIVLATIGTLSGLFLWACINIAERLAERQAAINPTASAAQDGFTR